MKCPDCNGSGKTAHKTILSIMPIDCPKCKGTGSVPDKIDGSLDAVGTILDDIPAILDEFGKTKSASGGTP